MITCSFSIECIDSSFIFEDFLETPPYIKCIVYSPKEIENEHIVFGLGEIIITSILQSLKGCNNIKKKKKNIICSKI